MKYRFRKKISLFLAMVMVVSNLAGAHVVWAEEMQESNNRFPASSSDASKGSDLELIGKYSKQQFDIKVLATKEVTIKASPSDASGSRNVVGSLKARTSDQEKQTMGAVLWFPLTDFKEATDDIVLSLTLKEDVGTDFSYGEVYLVPGKEVKSSSDWETLNQVVEEKGILAGSFERGIEFVGGKGEKLLVPVTEAVEEALDMEWNTGAVVIMAGDEGEDNAISFYTGNRKTNSVRCPMLMTMGEDTSESIETEAEENTYVQGGTNADQPIASFSNAEPTLLRNKYSNGAGAAAQTYTRMSIIRFPISSIDGQEISDYSLHLTVFKVGPDFDKMQVYAVEDIWARENLTFNMLTGLLADKTPDMVISREDIIAGGAGIGYVEVSVAKMVEKALKEGRDSLSLAFKMPSMAQDNMIDFYSVEEKNPANRPRLITVFESQKAIESLKPVSVLTYIGEAPQLPETVTAVLEDGENKAVSVVWDVVEAEQYAQTGTFNVKGSVEGTEAEAEATVTVKKKLTSDAVEIYASRDAYIQKGDCSSLIYDQWPNPTWSPDKIRIKHSNSNQSYTRNGYVVFPLDQDMLDNNMVKLVLTLSESAESQWSSTRVNLLKTTEFSYDTITYNTAPESEDEACGVILKTSLKDGKVSVDVTDVVLEALLNGETEIGFMLENTKPEGSNGINFYSVRAGQETAPVLSFAKEAVRDVEAVEVETKLNVAPILPEQVKIIDPIDGGMADVLWDEIEEQSYGKISTFIVRGVLKEYEYQVSATVNVVLPENYSPKTYYIDATGGNDENTGLSEDVAWRSLDKISSTMFLPGDSILLKAGEIWNGYVKLRGSGIQEKPITLSSYGEGGRPILNGGGTDYAKRSATVLLDTEEYWEISNLEITNKKANEDFKKKESNIYSRSGVLIYTTDQVDRKDHIYVTDCYIHDVVSNGNGDLPTTTLGGKLSGGIIFIASYRDLNGEAIVPESENKAGHVDIRAERNIVKNVVTEGIRNSVEGKFGAYPVNCDDVYIGNNYIEGTLGDGIVLNQTKTGGLIEKNIVIDAGTAFNNGQYYAAAWVHYSHNAVFQYNEVYGMLYGNADGEAFDADNQCYGTVFQYNYSHDNNGGACLFMGEQYDSIFRYNISANDGWKAGEEILNDHTNPGVNNNRVPLVYNNTFYVGNERNKNTNLYGYTKQGFCNFRNNVVLASKTVAANNGLKFSKAKTVDNSIIENNYFSDENIFKTNRPSIELLKEKNNFFADPMLAGPELASEHDDNTQRSMSLEEVESLLENPLSSLRSRVSIFAPQENSPLIGAGIPIEGNDLKEDILGNPINKEHPAIGAIELKTVEYGIAVEAASGGSVQTDAEKARAGDTITVTVKAEEGYGLTHLWIVHGEMKENLLVTENRSSFTMPEGDVTVKAVFEKQEPVITTYKITLIAEGSGTVRTDKAMAQKGEIVTVTAVPDVDMVLSSITCKLGGQQVSMTVIGKTASFTMPEGDVTVKAVFEKQEPVITTYKITLIAEGSGTVRTDKAMAQRGELVTVTAVPDVNMKLLSITCKYGNQSVSMSATGNTALFKMPDGDVIITAQFTAIVRESDDDDDIVVTPQSAPIPDSWPDADWKRQENGQWKLLKKDGTQAAGWAAVAGKWYYLNPETGLMQTGWALVDNKWYYLGFYGDMLTNWISIDGIWYYCDETGKLLMDTITPDGYRVGESGAWIQ